MYQHISQIYMTNDGSCIIRSIVLSFEERVKVVYRLGESFSEKYNMCY